ncbi:Peptidoglycan deacetylase [Mucisphaera calidilacus]|uniref:Peptidoglycan deacetylase n=1 Tax=Mucisphaera calidilacus TaxID=2527982 RepID=A0A518C160_9BACT|nr:Peptidoglycan deacetylase [Mucisphaera calidilacus]
MRSITIDVEEAWQTEVARKVVPRSSWDHQPSRVVDATQGLLTLLAEHDAPATFFFLGCIARQHPRLVRDVADAGHEIACHGDGHDHLSRLNPISMLADVTRAKKTLEDLAGQPVLGYRAPTWSVTRANPWAIDVLHQAGFLYDASIFPTLHPNYGIPDAPISPFRVASRPDSPTLLAIPPLVWRLGGRNIPVAGGGYFRLLPLQPMLSGLSQARRDHRPAILYFHPWEFDADQPRLPLPLLSRLRMYRGVGSSTRRMARVLSTFAGWTSLAQRLPELSAVARTQRPLVLSTGSSERQVA